MNMHPSISRYTAAIAALCEASSVRQLDLFGSAALPNYENANDFDFLVEMGADSQKSQVRRMIELADGLEVLLGAHVDLVSVKSVRNPYFASQVQASRQKVYERA